MKKATGSSRSVLLDWIEWEGPIESEAERATREGLLPRDDATPEEVASHLQRFAERAWRRPVSMEELQPYLRAYESERAAGEESVCGLSGRAARSADLAPLHLPRGGRCPAA